ncbi:sialidase family protein [Amycolatopsis nigrescens]|uniref:sialidase family protein n=1 Tax=Amycolatopsis nigrescens TaxID=381445 RepID=UPI0003691836|nr:sialidase family protein [Amycolatopsis nigrescens]
MTGGEGVTARQASIEGAVLRLADRFFAVMCWLWTPAVAFVLVFGEPRLPVWVSVLVMIGSVLIVLPLGFAFWSNAIRAKTETRRLRECGQPPVAEIIGLERTAGEGGELDTVDPADNLFALESLQVPVGALETGELTAWDEAMAGRPVVVRSVRWMTRRSDECRYTRVTARAKIIRMKLRSATRRMLVLGLLALLGTAGTATADPVPEPPSDVNATGLPRGGWESVGPNSIGGLLAVSGPANRLVMMQPNPPALWTSDDRGGSWTAHRDLLQDTGIQGFFADPVDGNRMLALGNKRLDAREWRGTLLETTDGGQSWQTLREWFPEGAFQLATDRTGQTLVVQNLDGISVSTDGGAQWRDMPRTWPRDGIAAPVGDQRLVMVGDDAYFTTVHPEYSLWVVRGITGDEPKAERVYRPEGDVDQVTSDGRQLVATVGTELRGSTDGGQTWTVLRRDPTGQPLRDPRFVGGRLYIGTYQDLDVSTDNGRTWTRKPVPAAGEGTTDIIDLPAGAGKPATTLVSAAYRGVYADAGKDGYRQLGVPGETIRDLVATGHLWRQSVVAAGMQEIYNSPLPQGKITPSTRIWQSHPGDRLHENAHLSVSPNRPDVVWQATRNGFALDVLRSGDGGRSWQLISGSMQGSPQAILANPADPDRLLVSAFTPTGYVLYRSGDAGRNWEKLPSEGFAAFAGDPWNPNRVWGGNGGGLSRSDDGGRTWTKVSEESVSSIALSRWGGGRILVGGAGLLLSEDNGRSFRRVHDGEPRSIGRIVAHPFDPRVWFAASASGDGVLRSTDFGRTWSPLPGALPDSRVLSLAVSADGRFLFAGTAQSGAYRLTLY